MGNTFTLIAPDLRGHVKSTFGNSATAVVCEVGFEGPTKHVAVVSVVRIESMTEWINGSSGDRP